LIAQITRVLISSCYLPKCHDLPNAAKCYGGEEDCAVAGRAAALKHSAGVWNNPSHFRPRPAP